MKISKVIAWKMIALLLGLFLSSHMYADNIKGKILDEAGEPVIGANVIKKNSTLGTITDLNGTFSIEAVKGDVLQVTYLGYIPVEITVDGKPILVTLHEDVTGLDEVVVVGYGSIEKKKLTSAIASVKSDDFLAGSVKDAGQLIQGKIS